MHVTRRDPDAHGMEAYRFSAGRIAPRDEGKTAAKGGTLTMEEWAAKVQRDEG